MLAGAVLVVGTCLATGAQFQWPSKSDATAAFSEKPPVLKEVPTRPEVKALSQTFVSLAEQLSPTVVNIFTKQGPDPRRQQRFSLPTPLPFGDPDRDGGDFSALPFNIPRMPVEALGSGFVINAEEGYIVTNAHVVRQAGRSVDEIMIKFIGEDHSKGHPAKIMGVDEVSDVALLKLSDKLPNLKAATFGDSGTSKVGEWVLAIGNPYGHTHTVTQGIISALGRNLDGARSDFLQTSASINPGNSGGPLFNMEGQVIGINSAIDPRAQNIGFAVPVNTVKDVVAQLVNGGKVHRAWLGVAIADIGAEAAGLLRLKENEGVLIREVMANAPAAKAGLEPYDVIRKFNGAEVRNTHDLYRSIDKLKAGSGAEVEVLRGGERKTVKITLGDQPTTG